MESGKTTRQVGQHAEQLAEQYLIQRGLRLVERNYRCRGGEIDLIMTESDTLVFVEVRYRKHQTFGGAAASVDQRKQQRLLLAANHYLQRSKAMDRLCRFDIVAISPAMDGQNQVQWISNAIESS